MDTKDQIPFANRLHYALETVQAWKEDVAEQQSGAFLGALAGDTDPDIGEYMFRLDALDVAETLIKQAMKKDTETMESTTPRATVISRTTTGTAETPAGTTTTDAAKSDNWRQIKAWHVAQSGADDLAMLHAMLAGALGLAERVASRVASDCIAAGAGGAEVINPDLDSVCEQATAIEEIAERVRATLDRTMGKEGE